jgi:protein-S-isoprenylcysteine O-methyltransferase Ste14
LPEAKTVLMLEAIPKAEANILNAQKWNSRLMAGEFEFRQRVWIIGTIYAVGFLLYFIDHQNSGHVLAQFLARLRGATDSLPDHRLVFGAAALIAAVASAIRTWGTAYLQPEVVLSARVQTARLVADGPYRFVRNPLYLGNILIAIGMGLMASRLGFAFLVLGNAVVVYRLMLREEACLEAVQGENYRAYCAAVPRLVPAFFPRVHSAGQAPNYAAGFLCEIFFWVFAASLLVFAVTLSSILFFLVLGSAFIIRMLSLIAIKQRGRRSKMEP